MLCGLVVVGSGCRRDLQPGVYELTEVFQLTRTPDGSESDRSKLPASGSGTFTFSKDGTYEVTMSSFGFVGEKACSGRYQGEWEIAKDRLRMTVTKARIPRYCRPEAERIYLYHMGRGGLTLLRHWDGNQFIGYFLEK